MKQSTETLPCRVPGSIKQQIHEIRKHVTELIDPEAPGDINVVQEIISGVRSGANVNIANINYAPINIHASAVLRICNEMLDDVHTDTIDTVALVRAAYRERIPMQHLLDMIRIEYAREALRNNRSVTGAAKALGMNPSNFSHRYGYLK